MRLRYSAQSHRQYVYQLPLESEKQGLAHAVNGWQVSGTVFWHSGVPFSVLSAPYSANGNGIVNGSGPQFASVVPGVPLYEHVPIPGCTQPGTFSGSTRTLSFSAVDPSTGACAGGDSRKPASSAIRGATLCGGRTSLERLSI